MVILKLMYYIECLSFALYKSSLNAYSLNSGHKNIKYISRFTMCWMQKPLLLPLKVDHFASHSVLTQDRTHRVLRNCDFILKTMYEKWHI